jgi:hypothetical protein
MQQTITALQDELRQARQEIVTLKREAVSRAELQAIAEVLHAIGTLAMGVWDQLRVATLQAVVDEAEADNDSDD